MNTRINRIIATYFSDMKDQLKKQILDLNFSEKEKINELLETIVEYPRLTLTKEDFVKRKRVKNSIPVVNRCVALRANGEQCTRRRRADCDYCGTHYKSSPNGVVDENGEDAAPSDDKDANKSSENKNKNQKLEVFAGEIMGLVYYLDKHGNAYKTEDIMQNKENPQIVAKYVDTNGVYTIPEWGLC